MEYHSTVFPFIMPVIHPGHYKVSDYGNVEACLRKTLESLTNQTDSHVKGIVVCHRIPSWASQYSDKVIFLNISNIPIFVDPKYFQDKARIDMGIKRIIGAIYSIKRYNPELIMLMDSDDYININLVDYLRNLPFLFPDAYTESDAFFIDKGAHVKLTVNKNYTVNYNAVYLINGFAGTCGSCRIFKTSALIKRFMPTGKYLLDRFNIWPYKNILNRFNVWPEMGEKNYLDVPEEPVMWLHEVTKKTYLNRDSIVNIMGRHIEQRDYFNIFDLPIIGAAKGCGHGNHDGPRGDDITEHKVFSTYPIELFYRNFGISPDL